MMRYAVSAAIIVGWDNFFLKQLVQRKAVCLCLYLCIVVFALFADRPDALAVVALCPPAIEDTTLRLTIERRLLTDAATGLVWTYSIIEPEVRTRHQLPR